MHQPQGSSRSILLIGTFLSASGRSRSVCEDLSERLATAGWQVFTTSSQVKRLPRLADMLQSVWRHRDEYALAQVDVYSGLAFIWAEVVCGFLCLLGKPFVLTLHGGRLPVFARRWPGRVRSLLAGAAAVTTPSNYLLEQMRPYRSDLRILPNAIDLPAYPFRLRGQLQPRLVWLRAFHHIYNPSLAVKVLARLKKRYPEAILTMIGRDTGDGSLQQTRQLVQALGLDTCVEFTGVVAKAEVPEYLSRADIFLNTTHIDNTPVSIIEALGCGLCVVSTRVGGISHLLAHEHDALLVAADDVDQMVASAERLLCEAELAQRLSVNGRKKAESFQWPVVLSQWQLLLDEILAGSAERGSS